jgi:hypothetical protein
MGMAEDPQKARRRKQAVEARHAEADESTSISAVLAGLRAKRTSTRGMGPDTALSAERRQGGEYSPDDFANDAAASRAGREVNRIVSGDQGDNKAVPLLRQQTQAVDRLRRSREAQASESAAEAKRLRRKGGR